MPARIVWQVVGALYVKLVQYICHLKVLETQEPYSTKSVLLCLIWHIGIQRVLLILSHLNISYTQKTNKSIKPYKIHIWYNPWSTSYVQTSKNVQPPITYRYVMLPSMKNDQWAPRYIFYIFLYYISSYESSSLIDFKSPINLFFGWRKLENAPPVIYLLKIST